MLFSIYLYDIKFTKNSTIEKDKGFYDKANKKINPEVVETIEAETERNEIILN